MKRGYVHHEGVVAKTKYMQPAIFVTRCDLQGCKAVIMNRTTS